MTTSISSSHAYDFKNRFAAKPIISRPRPSEGIPAADQFRSRCGEPAADLAKERGAGAAISASNGQGSMSSHISQFPVGTYKRGHAHGPSAPCHHPLGRRLFADVGRGPKSPSAMIGRWERYRAANKFFHQHFNSGPTPARYSAFKHEVG